MSNAPSRNPAGNDSLAGLMQFLFKKFLQKTDGCLPATVLAYSPSANRAQIQPAIVQITTGNTQIPRGQLASVPVAQIGAGGFLTYYPPKQGDTGWIIACDRDISLFKKTYKSSAPNTIRLHSFSDSWFLPDSMLNGVTLVDSAKMCIQSYDGTLAITMGAGVMNIIAPEINLNGNVSITGTFKNNTVDIGSTHVHSGVQTGSGDTGPPL